MQTSVDFLLCFIHHIHRSEDRDSFGPTVIIYFESLLTDMAYLHGAFLKTTLKTSDIGQVKFD